jgi:hypothetical protein
MVLFAEIAILSDSYVGNITYLCLCIFILFSGLFNVSLLLSLSLSLISSLLKTDLKCFFVSFTFAPSKK